MFSCVVEKCCRFDCSFFQCYPLLKMSKKQSTNKKFETEKLKLKKIYAMFSYRATDPCTDLAYFILEHIRICTFWSVRCNPDHCIIFYPRLCRAPCKHHLRLLLRLLSSRKSVISDHHDTILPEIFFKSIQKLLAAKESTHKVYPYTLWS